jgi:glycosyltransferase involved in cell wall biosynthesis
MLTRVERSSAANEMPLGIGDQTVMSGHGVNSATLDRTHSAATERAMSRVRDIAPEHPHLLCISGEDHHFRIPFMLALRDRGFRITAAGSGDPEPFKCAAIEFHRFTFERFVNPMADLAAIKMLSNLLADVRPDIVQTCDTKPNYLVPLAARRLRDLPIVRLINGRGWVFSSRSPRALALRPIYRALYRLANRSTAANVFQIQDDLDFFGKRRPSRNLVIPGWIDIDAFERALGAGAPPDRLRGEFNLGDAEIVTTVTRMTRQKGIPTLLEAASIVHQARPGVRFLLVGPRESEGPLAITQRELDHHAPYVIPTGPRSDVPAVLRCAHAFAFPTEYGEGIPRVLFEAALAGCPIVTTDVAGCRQVVQEGSSGFLVPPRAPHILADRILAVLRDRETAKTMASRAATLVREKFGLTDIVARYATLYVELLNDSYQSERMASERYRLATSPVSET